MAGTKELSITEVGALLKNLWSAPGAPPVLLIGPPGGGKTSICGQTAAEVDMQYEVLMGNSMEPSDVVGIPYLKGGEMVFAPPAWALRIKGKRAVLNFDELNTARPATLAALLRVILERRVGDIDLGPEVAIVATMNPAEEAAHGWELPPAVANRFLHFKVAPTSVADWKVWAASRDESPEYHALAESFPLPTLYSKPESGPFASPRSWHFALRAAAAMMRTGQPEMVHTVVAAAVSPGVALSWKDAQNIEEVSDWSTVDPGKVSLHLSRALEAAKADTKKVEPFWKLTRKIADHHIPTVFTFIAANKSFLEHNSNSATAKKTLDFVSSQVPKRAPEKEPA